MSFGALHTAIAELVLGAELDLDDRASVAAWLDRADLAEGDRQALLEGGLRRLTVYRRLVRTTLRDAVALAIERTVARMGGTFDEYFDGFLADHGPRTHYLRDVTTEFLDYCAEKWPTDRRVAAYLWDLARHENLQIEISSMPPAPRPRGAIDLSLDARLSFVEAARVVRYDHAVHELSEDPADTTPPARRPTALFVYRSPEHDVRYLELSPVAAELIERLLHRDEALGPAVTAAAAACHAAVTPELLEGTARLLADLSERGALLGARA